MKTKSSSVWMYTAFLAVVLFMVSCGNSQKKKEQAAEQPTEQQMPAGTVVESEAVVVEVDSIMPDTAAAKKNAMTPKKTK